MTRAASARLTLHAHGLFVLPDVLPETIVDRNVFKKVILQVSKNEALRCSKDRLRLEMHDDKCCYGLPAMQPAHRTAKSRPHELGRFFVFYFILNGLDKFAHCNSRVSHAI